MAKGVRIIVLNTDETFTADLRAVLHGFANVKIVAEVDEPALLQQAVKQYPVDCLVVNLDPTPEMILPIAGEIARANPELAVFSVSESTDGQLIIKAMRLGLREYFPRPIDAAALGEALERVANQRKDVGQEGKLISIIGSSGGVGATFLATNLAVELAQIASGSVTVVDLDYRYGQVATFLDVDPEHTLADLCASPEQLEVGVIEKAIAQHSSGVKVLARPNLVSQAETITGASCVGLLAKLVQCNEYVVTDGPIRFDTNAQAVLEFSDVSLLVVQMMVPSVRNAQRLLEALREDGCNLERMQIVCNRLGRDSGHLSVKDVKDTLKMDLFASIADDWAAVGRALNLGESLMENSPKSKARISIAEIAQSLHGSDEPTDEQDAHKKGLLGRIFAGS